MSNLININANVDGRTLAEFGKLLQARQEWLNESAMQSVSAMAENLLTSLRGLTKVFKPSHVKITGLKIDATLSVSFYKKGAGTKAIPCLRAGKVRYVKKPNEFIKWSNKFDDKSKVYRWKYQVKENVFREYLIVTNTESQATKVCKEIVLKRAKVYAGLAKHALSRLMQKAYVGNTAAETLSQMSRQVADRNTSANKVFGTDTYKLELRDDLLYSVAALKNGESDIQTSFQKALNKITSVINMKCKNILGFEKLDTPFPELKQRK